MGKQTLIIVASTFVVLSLVAVVTLRQQQPVTQEVTSITSLEPSGSTVKNIAGKQNQQFDEFGIRMLNQTAVNGRVWYSNWNNGKDAILNSGKRDPYDTEFIARGNGKVSIDGEGIATMSGDSPRMYIYDAPKLKKWNNVEVTVYAMRVSETGVVSSQGFVIGARSEHQDATPETPCFGRTYYGRLLYDGRTVFQKEIIHEVSYSNNKPTENLKADWGTEDGTIPKNKWIGMKFIVHTNPDEESVHLELYRDLTDGKNGGIWEKMAEYTDNGNWSQINSGVDTKAICGYAANKVLLDPGTSVFIRNDLIGETKYKEFSIREII